MKLSDKLRIGGIISTLLGIGAVAASNWSHWGWPVAAMLYATAAAFYCFGCIQLEKEYAE